MATHRVAKGFKHAPITRITHADGVYSPPANDKAATTKGAMRLYRKTGNEQIEFADVIGVGRFTLPIPATRRI